MSRYRTAPSHAFRARRPAPIPKPLIPSRARCSLGGRWALLPATLTLLAVTVAAAADADFTGEQVYTYCVGCHGPRGEGAANGLFPRIAGLPQPYLDRQLHAFKSQTRTNKAMVPIFQHHRFDAEVIDLVAGHIAGFAPPTLNLWPYVPTPQALAAFPDQAAFKAAGAATYTEACAGCHGADAAGDENGDAPPLVAQYPAYLNKQLGDFARGLRQVPASGRCGDLTPAQAEAVIARIVELGK